MMAIGDRVRERREALRMNQEELSRAVAAQGGSLSQAQISGLEGGTVKRPRALPELAAALQTTVDWLLDKGGLTANTPAMSPKSHEAVSPSFVHKRTVVEAEEPLILYRSAPVGRGGETLVFKERAGLVPRPDFLRYSTEAFASTVTDDLNAPAYRDRDVVLVDPSTHARAGDDCMFVKNGAISPMETVSRHLVKITATSWTVHQYAGKARDYELSRADYPTAWPIVGRYNRR